MVHLNADRDDGHLYVMQAASGLIKIGRSYDPKQRRREIENASGHRVLLLLILPNRGNEEAAIHAKLAPHRGIGEWFAGTHEAMRDICVALGVVVKFRFSGASPAALVRVARQATGAATREHRATNAAVIGLAADILGHPWPPEWDEAIDAEEDMLDGWRSIDEVNAIRKRVGLPPLARASR